MKGLKIFLALCFVAAFSAAAMAQSVTINFSDGTLTFTRSTGTTMTIDDSGNATINVTDAKPTGSGGGGGTPTACTGWDYTAWGACQSSNTQTRTYSGYLPAGCTGTPSGQPVLSQACTYSGGGGGGIQGTPISASPNFNIAAHQTVLYYTTVAADCPTTTPKLVASITQQQSAPNVDMVVKKTNGNYGDVPTITNYNTLVATYGASMSGTKTNDGVYFVNFTPIPSGETVTIQAASVYLKSYPNFGTQHDTYYILLVNTTSQQATGNISNFTCK